MDNNPLTKVLRAIAAERVPTESSHDLWPAVRSSLSARSRPSPPRKIQSLRRPLAAGTAAFLALALLLMLVPAGRAAVRDVGVRFGFMLVERAPQSTTVPPAGVAAPRATYLPQLTLDEARARSPFPLRLPTVLPEGLAVRGATLGAPGPGGSLHVDPSISVYYATAAPPPAFAALTYSMAQGGTGAPTIVPTARAEEVVVRGQPALYAHGRWVGGAWDPGANSALLTWAEDGYTFTLVADGAGTGVAELSAIAASIR